MNQLNKHGTIPQIINDSEKSVEHPILSLNGYEILGAMYQNYQQFYPVWKEVWILNFEEDGRSKWWNSETYGGKLRWDYYSGKKIVDSEE